MKLFLELFIDKKIEYTFVCFFMHNTIPVQFWNNFGRSDDDIVVVAYSSFAMTSSEGCYRFSSF